MKKLSNYIFSISAKKLAILLVILPLVLIVLHTTFSVIYRNSEASDTSLNDIVSILSIIVTFCLLVPFLIWMSWLKGAVLLVSKKEMGIPLKWFNIALFIFMVYIVFSFCFVFIEFFPEGIRSVFSILSETISFAGLLIAYPLICHYAARAVFIKKHNQATSFSKNIVYTLLLIFIPISIPFFHNYFSSVRSENHQLVKIYLIALGILMLLAISTFVLAILGLI
ncbi:hypothetical protein UMM65_12910 [Aureibaculum sp. 2210JD6-5]|uniref:hypothetical protein n=1 Tax=Aureibaculum sp. 2210JD6-5 TaxID=3103957 RepID=UPI002AADD2CF|nr:hypothetical protein [Aureibaculum sp. 2210JD6-5]MDY7396144.1 hypothetical protein [Aureibaculum sp. 2210JD6-5]